tara:strand:- start:57 stop:344 length:288 start_codon:yes stop_codon:yes gene_type:complete
MIPNKLEAISSINPKAEATIKADGSLVWHKNPTNITDEQIATKLAELQADYDAKEYQRKREREYPSLQDCIHAILDDDLDNLQALRQAVKEKYPK